MPGTVGTEVTVELLLVHHQVRMRLRRCGAGGAVHQLHDGKGFHHVGGGRWRGIGHARPVPGAHEVSAPAVGGRVVGRGAEQVGEGGRVAHLDVRPDRGEIIAKRPGALDVAVDEAGIAQIAGLVAAQEPAAIGGVVLDDPQVRVGTLQVVVGVGRPFFVGATDHVHAQLALDGRIVVQRLRQVLEAAPQQHPQRTRIVAARVLDDPLRSFGGLAPALRAGQVRAALLCDGTQAVRRGIAVGPGAQVGIVFFVDGDDVEQVALAVAALAPRRGDQAFEVDHVAVEQQVHQRLEVVEIGAADVGGDDHARSFGGGSCEGRRAQAQQGQTQRKIDQQLSSVHELYGWKNQDRVSLPAPLPGSRQTSAPSRKGACGSGTPRTPPARLTAIAAAVAPGGRRPGRRRR